MLKAELVAMVNEEDNPAAPQARTAGDKDDDEDNNEPLPAKKNKKSFGSYFKKTHPAGGDRLQSAVEKELPSYLMIPETDSDANPNLPGSTCAFLLQVALLKEHSAQESI